MTRTATANRPTTPAKPYPTFELFAHQRGYWCKTIDKRHVSFGRWEREDNPVAYERAWKAALTAYHKCLENEAHGRHLDEHPDEITLKTLTDAYLTRLHKRLDQGDVTPGHFQNVRRAVTRFRDEVGPDRTIAVVERDGIDDVREYVDKLRDDYGWSKYNQHIQAVRAQFRWAMHPVDGVLGRPFRLLDLLEKQGELARKREVKAKVIEKGQWCFTVPECWAYLHAGGLQYMAFVLLGYFCAYGNTDCADLTTEHVNFAPDPETGLPTGWGIIHFPRPKNEIERACVIPPIVCDVLKAVLSDPARPKPARPQWAKLVFLTKHGFPYVRDKVHRRADGVVENVVTIDSVGLLHKKARARLGQCPAHGVMLTRAWMNGACPCEGCKEQIRPARTWGFYTFRHTAITYASGTSTPDALALWEGHVIKDVRNRYVSHVEVPRLKPIADALLARLFVERGRAVVAVAADGAL